MKLAPDGSAWGGCFFERRNAEGEPVEFYLTACEALDMKEPGDTVWMNTDDGYECEKLDMHDLIMMAEHEDYERGNDEDGN